jgi:hypothetical protein
MQAVAASVPGGHTIVFGTAAPLTPEELARGIAEDNVTWQRIVKRAGITPG